MRKKLYITLAIITMACFLFSCEDGLYITHREITSVPDKLKYAQYYDKEIDFTGGEVTIYLKGGGKQIEPMEEDVTLKQDVNFNNLGTYKIYLAYTGEKTSFNIQVVPIEQADWLDEKTRNGVIKWSSIDTTQDQAAIKEIINKFFTSDLEIFSDISTDKLNTGIQQISVLLDSDAPIYENYIPALKQYYEKRIENDYSGFKLGKVDNVYNYIYVQGNTAEVGVTEIGQYTKNDVKGTYTLQFKHTLTFIKKGSTWYINRDVTNRFNIPMGLWS